MKLILMIFLLINQPTGWSLLEDVKFKSVFNEKLETYVDDPTFGENLITRDGKKIKIKGYFMPFELNDPRAIILSKYPYSSCFFCGGAGLESVVEVYFEGPPKRFKTDEVVTIEGVLKLNYSDYDHLVFIVENANRMVWEDREQ